MNAIEEIDGEDILNATVPITEETEKESVEKQLSKIESKVNSSAYQSFTNDAHVFLNHSRSSLMHCSAKLKLSKEELRAKAKAERLFLKQHYKELKKAEKRRKAEEKAKAKAEKNFQREKNKSCGKKAFLAKHPSQMQTNSEYTFSLSEIFPLIQAMNRQHNTISLDKEGANAAIQAFIEKDVADIARNHHMANTGFGYQIIDHHIETIMLTFSSTRTLDTDSARKLSLACIKEIIEKINHNEALKPYLKTGTFDLSQLDFSLNCHLVSLGESSPTLDGQEEFVSEVNLRKGTLTYKLSSLVDSSRLYSFQEDYPFALEKARAPTTLS